MYFLVLQKDYNDLKEELHAKTEELEKLHMAAKENVSVDLTVSILL